MKPNLVKKIAIFVGLSFVLSVQAEQKSIDKNQAIVTKTVTAWMEKNQVPGVAVEVYGNGVPHSYYYGYSNRETKLPINQNTIFEVGSFTKLFTSLLIAEELNSGKIKLSDPIPKFAVDLALPNNPLNNVTLQNLATHTSGLPFALPKNITQRSELRNFFSNWNPASPIGTQWGYSNINIGLLGYALENVTHRNINQLYRERILQPLGMEPIGIIVAKKYQLNYAQGYNKDGQPIPHTKVSLFPAAGAMKISAQDMLYFLKAAIRLPGTPEEISNAMRLTQTAFVSTANMEQGLGWVIYPFNTKYAANLLKIR